MRILSYVKSMDACSYHRVYLPNQFIDAEVRHTGQFTEEDLAWCDMVIYSRHTMVAPEYLNQFRDKYGFKIVVDTDDWWEVSKDHPKYHTWGNTGLQIRKHLMNADACITTNDRLAREIPNNKVYVIPNMLPYGWEQFSYSPPPSPGPVRLLYASTIMNYSNTELISRAMNKIAGMNVEVVIAGYHKSPLFDILVKNLTAGKIPHRFVDMKPALNYMYSYEGDIGLLPSKPTKFNSFKSNLKVLEYGAIGIPALVSKCDPYLDLPVNYFGGEKDFIDQLVRLIEDEEYRRFQGETLQKFCVENYDIRNSNRKSVYEQII